MTHSIDATQLDSGDYIYLGDDGAWYVTADLGNCDNATEATAAEMMEVIELVEGE